VEWHNSKISVNTRIIQQHISQQLTIKMNLLLFCIAIIVVVFASLEAASITNDEYINFGVCPESHRYAFDHGKV
jgi:hypothetical protein